MSVTSGVNFAYVLEQRYRNFGNQEKVVIKFCKLATNIFGSSVCTWLNFALLAAGVFDVDSRVFINNI